MPKPIALRGVIVLAGPPNLKAFQQKAEKSCGTDVVGNLVGNVPDRYKQVSPNELLPIGVPQILIFGADDKAVPAKYAIPYVQLAQKKGDQVKLTIIKYAAHHEYIVPNAVSWPALKSAVFSLLHKNK